MKKKLIIGGLAAVLALSAVTAMAQGHRDRPDLAAMDTDADGALSLEEVTAFAQTRAVTRATAMFTRLDTDADGAISAAEFEAAQDRRGHRGTPPADE